jgi:hypothetical protein
MQIPRFLVVVGKLINAASIIAWLISLGVGVFVTAALGWLASFESPWQYPLWAGLFLLVTGSALAVASRFLPPPPVRTSRPRPGHVQGGPGGDVAIPEGWIKPEHLAEYLDGINEMMREKGFGRSQETLELAGQNRARIHEVMTTLEYHKAEIERYTRSRTPSYQGSWPENRQILAQDARYDRAVRAVERAFNAIPYFVGSAAIAPIDEALAELQALLDSEGQ